MSPEERIAQIEETLRSLAPAWQVLTALLDEKARALTGELIAQDNEQTRGRIKQLRELMELPELLQQERDGIRAALAE